MTDPDTARDVDLAYLAPESTSRLDVENAFIDRFAYGEWNDTRMFRELALEAMCDRPEGEHPDTAR